MKVQTISSYNYNTSKPAFKSVGVVANKDFEKLIDYAAQKPDTTKELMVALKMLHNKKQNAKIEYTTTRDGEIVLTHLDSGRSVLKINDYNSTSQGANLRSFMRFASPSDEQHQRLLGGGMTKQESEELKDISSLAVYEEVQKSPLYKEIKELEIKKLDKAKELIRSFVITG